MPKLVIVISTILGVVVGLADPSMAQPAPGPSSPPPAGAAAPPTLAPASLPPSEHAPSMVAPRSEPRPEQRRGRRRSVSTALALALGGTLGSWGLVALSGEISDEIVLIGLGTTVFGPNLGHWHQGTPFTRGTLLRVVAAAGSLYALDRIFARPARSDSEPAPGPIYDYALVAGLVLYFAATVDDIVDAPLRAWKHNRRLEGVVLAPMITDRSAGMALGGRF